ncbi:MAG: type I 3-dehydroquinate dehydratase [Phycisphaerales bacterium]
MSLICTPILVHDFVAALEDARAAKAAGADLVEFRIDELPAFDEPTLAAVASLVADCPLPCILTCRTTSEGGGCDLPDAERVAILERLTAASRHPPTYLDVEWSSFSRSANLAQKVRLCVAHAGQLRDQPTRLVLSTHDFQQRPADLARRVAGMAGEDACAVIKAAWRARSLHDAIEAVDLPAQTGRPTIAVAMGEFGVLSRVLAPKAGGLLTFAPLRPGDATAPGQVTVHDLLHLYRFRSITPATRVYGVIGYPVGHSLSPVVHNAGFGQLGVDAVYVPMPVASYTDADATYAGFRAAVLELIDHPTLRFCGASVTMPHKEHLARLARERGWGVDGAAGDLGVANTLVVERENGAVARIRVANTDVQALVSVLEGAPGVLHGSREATARVGVIGAGGMGKAAAYACARAGAHVVVYNRDGETGRRVAAEVAERAGPGCVVTAAEMHLLPRACCDAFVQCTPLGMEGSGLERQSALPVHDMHACPRGVVVIETVYRPLRTPTVVAAEEKGWGTITGDALFVHQALLQMGLWTGCETGGLAGLYKGLVLERLKAVSHG